MNFTLLSLFKIKVETYTSFLYTCQYCQTEWYFMTQLAILPNSLGLQEVSQRLYLLEEEVMQEFLTW